MHSNPGDQYYKSTTALIKISPLAYCDLWIKPAIDLLTSDLYLNCDQLERQH